MAREINDNFKKTTYLSINSDGYFQSTLKDPAEGYEEYITSKGNKRYKKLFAGSDFGFITDLRLDTVDYGSGRGKEERLLITVESNESRDIIQLPIMTEKGTMTDTVRKFTALLPNIDFSRELTISANKKKNDRGYVDKVIFVNYIEDDKQGESVKFALKFGEGGDIPMFTKKEHMGKITYDFTDQDNFLYDKLTEQLERFSDERPTLTPNSQDEGDNSKTETSGEVQMNNTASGNEPVSKSNNKSTTEKIDTSDDDDDELPF